MMTSVLLVTSLLVACVAASNFGVEFVGVGYNLLTGNPDGGDSQQGGVDPGLLYTKKILHISHGNNPPEVVVEQRHSCVRVQETHVFYGTKSYQDKLALGVKASGSFTEAIMKFAFSLSGRYAHTKEETTRQHQVFFDDQKVCNLGRATYADELAKPRAFSVSQNFAAAACVLPVTYNETQYMDFIDHWGTHVTMEVELGTKSIRRYKSSLSEFVQHVTKQGGGDVSVGGSYMGYGASLAVNFDKYKGSSSYKQNFGEYQYTLEAGTSKLPEPIKLTIASLDSAFNPKYWQKLNTFLHQHLCDAGTSTQDLLRRQANVIKAISNYAAYKMAHSSKDPPLKIPITWPQGTYGLPKPKTGCPSGRTKWYEGWRYEDLEDMFNHNHVSGQLHLAGTFKANIRYEFCMKGDEKSTAFDMMWPAGDYCVLKYRQCPPNFQEGWILWTDEYRIGGNLNKAGGTLPDGNFGENTKIYYCCRDDGVSTHNIAMPTSKPFYLMRNRHDCQHVRGMRVSEEYVEEDTNGFWKHTMGGSHPYLDGNRPRLHYCYYTPIHSPTLVG